jgi:aminotransferase
MDFNKYISQKTKSIEISTIRHFFNIVKEVEDVISLCIGEPDFTTPAHINQGAIQALRNGKTYYTPNAGLFELREEISRYLKRRLE